MDEEQKSNNCFLPSKGQHFLIQSENETFLYDEAEQLLYECSETSFPAAIISENQLREIRGADSDWETSSAQTTVDGFEIKMTPYYSAASSKKESTTRSEPQFADNRCAELERRDKSGTVTEFEKAIIEKFKEMSKSSLDLDNESRLEELFIRKTPFFVSSSESDPQANNPGEDVFSTGASDCDVVATVSSKRRQNGRDDSLPEMDDIVRTKSIVIGNYPKKKEPQEPQKNSVIQPTSGRPSARSQSSMKTSKPSRAPQSQTSPCHLFVQEIRQSNLVMKEDIFSSSIVRSSESVDSVETECEKEKKDFHKMPTVRTRMKSPWRITGMNVDVEVYETSGGERKSTAGKRAVEIEVVKAKTNKCREPDGNRDQRKEAIIQTANYEPAGSMTEPKRSPCPPKLVDVGVGPSEQSNQPTCCLMNACAVNPSDKILSKYVKLPGFPEAFKTHDCVVKELRIKDGTSFESINALEVLSTSAHLMPCRDVLRDGIFKRNVEPAQRFPEGVCPKVIETKDAETDLRILNQDVVTQTDKSNSSAPRNDPNVISTAETSVQCESQMPSRYEAADLREIMVCDDEGNGVQLYNILGHPLTDMDGYLLKDSLGRFLARLDQFGVPSTCTNGDAIFLENGREWTSVKSRMNVIHQGSKRNIVKRAKERRNKLKHTNGAVSMRQISNAMRDLTHTIEWANHLTLDEPVDVQCMAECVENNNPSKSQSPHRIMTNNVVENSSTLVAEMRSMAKLRNALLEKVNFIAGHRKPLHKSLPNGSNNPCNVDETSSYGRTTDGGNFLERGVFRSLSNDGPHESQRSGLSYEATINSSEDKVGRYSWKNSILLSSSGKTNLERSPDAGLIAQKLPEPKMTRKELSVNWQPKYLHEQPPQVKGKKYNFAPKTPENKMEDRAKQTGLVRKSLLGKWSDSKPTIESNSSSSLITSI